MRRPLTALALACHPAPTAAVTVMMTGLFAAAGNNTATTAVGTAAVLTGQVSIGWSNDAFDARRDERSGRTDKPVASGRLSAREVLHWAWTAAGGCVVLSILLGWRAGLLHLLGVGCGWLYNTVAKHTWWSPAPFAIAFGALPAVATLSRTDRVWPPGWSMVAAGLIGVAAHFANVLPDLADDRLTGVLGLPQRVGAGASTAVALGCAVAACAIVVLAPDGGATDLGLAALAASTLVAVAGLALWSRAGGGEAVFGATIVIAAIVVIVLSVSDGYPGT